MQKSVSDNTAKYLMENSPTNCAGTGLTWRILPDGRSLQRKKQVRYGVALARILYNLCLMSSDANSATGQKFKISRAKFSSRPIVGRIRSPRAEAQDRRKIALDALCIVN
jgi:hypothetical protein